MSPLKTRGRRTLLMLALVCAAPVAASYVAYYWFRPPGQVNYGELLEVKAGALGENARPCRRCDRLLGGVASRDAQYLGQ